MTAIHDRDEILRILDTVTDPEIPVLTVRDLGIIREIRIEGEEVEVVITPTYSGCPAMHMIEVQIIAALREAGVPNPRVRTVLSPAWTTAWISAEGRDKLERYGIAPPREKDEHPPCPRCGDRDTRLLSQFGSTACKALWQCSACKEPFDYFKCH
jgi:ring-1,2-phenylacetyl-CoA epoxidase subunit PaaD